MLDVAQGLTEEDIKIYDMVKDKPMIVLVNKTDLDREIDEKKIKDHFKEHPLLWISVKEEIGLDNLKEAIIEEVVSEEVNVSDNIFITRVRHKDAMKKAVHSINRVKESLNQGLPYDFLTIDLKDCLDALGEITGETVTEDIIDRIFADFCLGK